MRLWTLTRRPASALAVLALVGVLTGTIGALAPTERLQFLPAVGAIVLGWSMRFRDDPHERVAPYPPHRWDAGLLVTGTVIMVLTISATLWLIEPGQLPVHRFTLWGSFFSVGALAVGMAVASVLTAGTVLALLHLTLFTVRYLIDPGGATLALIHQESPAEIAWPLSLLVWSLGIWLVALGPGRGRPTRV